MPDVFDKKTRTKLRVADPGSDKKLPEGGALSYGSITGTSALSGTTGVDVMLVHGDRWQEMKGSLTENYAQDKTITVKGKHTETITGDRNLTVNSGNTENISKSHEATVGMSFKLTASQNVEQSAGMKHSVQATMVENTASGMSTNKAGGVMTVQGSLVKINC